MLHSINQNKAIARFASCFWRVAIAWNAREAMAGMMFLATISAIAATGADGPTGVMQPLPYNHPGLVVDLGVGLWAWPIPCDADDDGDYDLLVSCPDRPSNGVWLFENRDGDTRVHSMPCFQPARRISSTVHYVMPSYVEGRVRVLSPGVEYPRFLSVGIEEAERLSIDPNFFRPQGTQTKGPKVRHNQWRYVDFNGDGELDLSVGIEDWSHYGWDDAYDAQGRWTAGPLKGYVFVFLKIPNGDWFEPGALHAGGQRLETFGCPSPNFEDFDGDGDLDLLCGEFLDGLTYFQNLGSRSAPVYGPGQRVRDASGRDVRMDLQMIVPIAFDWDRDGHQDLIIGDEDGRVAWVRHSGVIDDRGVPQMEQPRYFQQLADTLKCGALATPVGIDWDDDGDDDLVSGNTAGYIEWFENLSGPKVEYPRWNAPKKIHVGGQPFRVMAGENGSIQGPAEAKWGYTTLSVADWNGDGKKDIVYNSIHGDVMWMPNRGSNAEPRFDESLAIEVEWQGPAPVLTWGWRKPEGASLTTQWRTTPVVYDFNQDGLPDLAMLDTEGYLAFFERIRKDDGWVLRAPQRLFYDEEGSRLRLNAKRAGGSGRRKLSVVDWNGDGRFDWLVNSKNADLLVQTKAERGGWSFQNQGSLNPTNIEGHDVSPTTVDFDGNGIPDFVGGAEDGRMYYLRHPRSMP